MVSLAMSANPFRWTRPTGTFNSCTILASTILRGAVALNPDNTLGSLFIGTEADLDLQYNPAWNIKIDLVNSFFYPGRAASAFVNPINLENQRPLYRLVTSVSFLF